MSSQFGVRNLLIATGVVAACMLLIVYTIRNPDSNLAFAMTACLAMVASVFLLFALTFILLLPWGVVHDFARESIEPAVSPFASDRLPEQKITTKDIEPAR
jgi:Na+/melibiose symporter-like transporter